MAAVGSNSAGAASVVAGVIRSSRDSKVRRVVLLLRTVGRLFSERRLAAGFTQRIMTGPPGASQSGARPEEPGRWGGKCCRRRADQTSITLPTVAPLPHGTRVAAILPFPDNSPDTDATMTQEDAPSEQTPSQRSASFQLML